MELFEKYNKNNPEKNDVREQLRFIIEKRDHDYIDILFNKNEIISIALQFGIEVSHLNKETKSLSLEIYKRLGFNVDRSDYLEL
jgi:hypothetical protein